MAGLRLFNFTQQLLELSMRVRGARHEVLSANIANVDTPGYRPRDVDFGSIMRSAAEMDDSSAGSREQQMERLLTSLDLQTAIYEPTIPNNQHGEDRLDGNSVGLDQQIALLNENSLSYEASLTLLSRTLAKLRYVISEGRA
ncbi:MAG TPA: flagellar basal body rod protein FlgB [Methylomirabilota bacterium]|nr:flagellar basal body rod protein FlgB [Methylomirabilota bacterium]